MRRTAVASFWLLFAATIVSAADTPASPPTFTNLVKENFAKWDNNSDSVLSLEEINRAVIDPKVKGAEAAAIAALRRFARNTKANPTKLTQEEIAKSIEIFGFTMPLLVDENGVVLAGHGRLVRWTLFVGPGAARVKV